MGKETSQERQFSEDVDRLLNGEEVAATQDMNEGYRTAVNFAKKLSESRLDPSTQFKDQLKQRLLLELTRQEVAAWQKEKGNWFWRGLRNLVPESAVWRSLTATLIVIIMVAGVAWRMGIFTPSPELAVKERQTVMEAPLAAPVPAPEMATEALARGGGAPEAEAVSEPLLEVEVVPLKTIVSPLGETIQIELVFKNVSSESVTVAPFPPAIQVVHSGTGELVHSFPEGNERLELSPSERLNYTLVWDQQDNNGEQVAPGWYSISAGDIALYKDTEPGEIYQSLFLTLTHWLIQFSQGAMEKVVELNQTQTVNDLSITLEQVELSAERVVFSAFFTPADYSSPQDSPGVRPKGKVLTFARYIVDGAVKDAGYAEVQYLDDGIRLIWGRYQPYLDPLPSDARELVFIIGDEWQGTWQFSIPLQN